MDRPGPVRPEQPVREWWPAAAAVLLFGMIAAYLVRTAQAHNGGKWIYPLDDAYIHLATVKQLVRHGVWGISYLNGFSSCLSSLLYPLLLAVCFECAGVNAWAPLALNVVAAVVAIFYAGHLLRRHTRSGGLTFLVLAGAVLGTPLPMVAVTGMEHTWQIVVDLWLLDLAVRALADEETVVSARWARRLLPLGACLAVMIRYEGLFFVAIIGLLLLCRGRFVLAVGVGVGAALPLAVFGWYSVQQGWAFLPNSVLLKGGGHLAGLLYVAWVIIVFAALRRGRLTMGVAAACAAVAGVAVLWPPTRAATLSLGATLARSYYHEAHLFVLLLLLTVALDGRLRSRPSFWNRTTLALCILLVVAVQHLEFAGVGWVYRYEAYLMYLGLVVVGIALVDALTGRDLAWLRRQPRRRVVAAGGLAAVLCLPLAVRTGRAFYILPAASHNIYDQQYQMARFVRRFYDGAGVAANDIGAIDYLADLHLVDTWGLADNDVFRARRRHAYNQAMLRDLLARRDVRLVMVYESWASEYGGILPEWVPVGRWTISHNVICGGDTVSFYAPDASAVPALTQALRAFAPALPGDVRQAGLYLEGN